jgi:hypothetical protein
VHLGDPEEIREFMITPQGIVLGEAISPAPDELP